MLKKSFCKVLTIIAILTILAINPVKAGSLYTRGPNFNISFNPEGGVQVGQDVNIHIKVDSTNPGATRINVSCGGVSKGETSEVEFDSTWYTGNCSGGNANINVCTKASDDPNWQDPNCNNFGYSLWNPPPPPGPSRGPNISIFSFSPESATVGDSVNIHIRVDSNNPGATTITVGCGDISKNETSEVEFDSNWNTSACGDGNIKVKVCSRATDDPNWANANCTDRNYSLSPKQSNVPAPQANLWVDSDSIATGSCTNLHWTTTNATSAEIDGTSVTLSGDLQVCPTVTKKYSLSVHGSGGNTSRNLTVVVSGNPQSLNVADHFATKDLIDINGNLYVIVNGEKRHVPNPETLDALGLSRELIDNKGFSTSDLNKIPTGSDIPDVNIDKAGFDAFKATYFANLVPIVPNQNAETIPSTGGQIQIIPNGPQGLDGNCPASPAVLTVGNQAAIAGKDLNLRPNPNVNTDPITIIPNFAYVSVIAGPKCQQEVRWFKVEYKGIQGWAAEVGTGGEYHMYPIVVEPLVTTVPLTQSDILPTNTPQPLVEAPIEPVAIEEPFYCSWWIIGWLACDLAEANSVEAWCEPQCMTQMRKDGFRPDMNRWSPGTGDSTPLDVLANAEKETPYNDPPKTGPLMQIRVRESNETPQTGDLIIWQANCGGASSIGHIGEVVSSVGITVNISDANWDNKCGTRNDVQIQILSCMRFVTKPFPAGTYVPTVQPTVINCADYQGWQNFACNYIPWWKP